MSRSTITPHPSHTWGTVEGETRCVICWVAPDWPVSEQECDIAATTPAERAALLSGRPAVRGPAMPNASLEMGVRLRAEGMQWAAIAAEVGYSSRAIQQAVLRYHKRGGAARRRGALRKDRKLPTRMLQDGDMAVVIERQKAGHLLTDIAEDLGVPYDSLRQRLRRDIRKQA